MSLTNCEEIVDLDLRLMTLTFAKFALKGSKYGALSAIFFCKLLNSDERDDIDILSEFQRPWSTLNDLEAENPVKRLENVNLWTLTVHSSLNIAQKVNRR